MRWRPEWFPDGVERNLVDANLRWADLREADLRGALNLDPAADFAIWFQTTCPDGSLSIGNWPCFGDQLIPF